MTGKEKCKLLKAIRREIAENNGIVYLTSECSFEGECSGTCPKCDAEIRYLDGEINRLAREGKHVNLAGISLNTFEMSVQSADKSVQTQPSFSVVEKGSMPIEPPTILGSTGWDGSDLKEGGIRDTLDDLDLSVRAYNCLRRAGITSISELIDKSYTDLMRVRNLGRKSLEEVIFKLYSRFGITIREEADFLEPTFESIRSIIMGSVVADALGVPVEFQSREQLKQNPVVDMMGFGTHHVPAGTWSDDTSMTLATLDSLCAGLDYTDMMEKFCSWKENASYTATDEVFDMGISTNNALKKYRKGVSPLSCGGTGEHDNGNGSLMRITPAVLYALYKHPDTHGKNCIDVRLEVIHNVSKLTHAHLRSQIGCGIFGIVLENLLRCPDKSSIITGLSVAKNYYSVRPEYSSEIVYFNNLFSPDFLKQEIHSIKSSGYVVDTLEAAVWCLYTTSNFKDCVLTAVNLGQDTDTVAAVAGALAGCLYRNSSLSGVPAEWIEKVIRSEVVDALCNKFTNSFKTVVIDDIPVCGGLRVGPADDEDADPSEIQRTLSKLGLSDDS